MAQALSHVVRKVVDVKVDHDNQYNSGSVNSAFKVIDRDVEIKCNLTFAQIVKKNCDVYCILLKD